MKLPLTAEPSALPEITEFSLSLVLLAAMFVFLGGVVVRQADHVLRPIHVAAAHVVASPV